jgi:integrase
MPRKRKRTWGTGGVTQRGNRWQIRWSENGQRRSKSYATKELAEKVLAKITRDAAVDGVGLPRDRSDAPTLEELFKPWLERRRRTHRTASDDGYRWRKHLSPTFGRLRPVEVNAAKLRQFIEMKLAEGLAAQTVGHCIRLLSTLFSDVVEQGHVAVNPVSTLPRSCRALYRSTYDVRSTAYLEHKADIERLFRALEPPHNVLFLVGALTGARVGELLALQWQDIGFAAGKILIRWQAQDGKLCPLKDKESRIVPLATDLAPVLAAWKLQTGAGATGQLFTPAYPERGGRPGSPARFVRPQTVHAALAKALKKCDLPKLTLYEATRHTYASQWVKAGGSMEELARYMGHSSTSTTQHYAHLAPDYIGPKARDMIRVTLAPPAGDVVRLAPTGAGSGPFGSTTGTKHQDTAPAQLSLIG